MAETPFNTLTPEKRAAAMEKARANRSRRAEVKKALAAGEITFSGLFELDEEAVAKAKVSEVIRALPGYGNAKTAAIMEEVGVAENRRLGGLGSKQKAKLIEILG